METVWRMMRMTERGLTPLYDKPVKRIVLSPQQLRLEQERTLAMPPEPYGFPALLVFQLIDLIYGTARTWQKFKVNEIMARMPYQAWEQSRIAQSPIPTSRSSMRSASSNG